MRLIVTVLVLFMLLLAGCSNSANQQKNSEEPQLKVTLESDPKQIQLNEKVTFTSKVTYGTENVSEEAKVTFEVIENGVSFGRLPVEPNADGIYQLDVKFVEPGEHQVIAHVDYQGLHEMPILSFHLTE